MLALDVMLTWIDNSVPAGQRGLIFASIDRLDIYARSEIIVSRFMSTHHNGLVNCISTLLDIKVKRDHMAGIHSMLDESSNVMVRIRKHIADGALDILDVLHTMVLLRALPNTYSILVVALSGEANLTRMEAERRILLEAERQATHSKGVVGNSSGHAKSTGKSFQRNSNHNKDRRNDHPPAVSKDQVRNGSRPDFNGQLSHASYRPVQPEATTVRRAEVRPSGSGEKKKKVSFQNRGKGKSSFVPQGHSKSTVAQLDDDQHGWTFTATSCADYSPRPGSLPDDVDDDNDKEIPLIGRAFKTQNVPGEDSDDDSVQSTLSDRGNQIDEVPSPGPTVTANDPTVRDWSRPCRSSHFAQYRRDRIAGNLQDFRYQDQLFEPMVVQIIWTVTKTIRVIVCHS